MEKFEYKALRRNEIRLLKLLPWNPTRSLHIVEGQVPLHGQVLAVQLNAVPEYEALSYAWGKPILDQPLPLSDAEGDGNQQRVLRITKDLHTALMHLRHATETRMLWVDQVCINQNDVQERSSQVRHMGRIYRLAAKTIAWLGKPERDCDVPLLAELFAVLNQQFLSLEERAQRLHDNPDKYWRILAGPEHTRTLSVQRFHDRPAVEANIDVSNSGVSTRGAQRRQAVVNFFNQTWFTRAWVVQEVLLAKGVEMMYGSLCETLESVFRLGSAVVSIENNALGWKHHIQNTTKGYGGFQSIATSKWLMLGRSQIDEDFLKFLSTIRGSFSSTDPRDKIYAILGLKPPASAPVVVPDYTKPTIEVYTETALSFIKSTSSLEIFSFTDNEMLFTCPCPNSHRLGSALPSWVPNWNHASHGPIPFSRNFRSSGNHPHTFTTPEQMTETKLFVKGKLVAVVENVLPQTFDKYTPFVHGVHKMIQLDDIMAQVDSKAVKDAIVAQVDPKAVKGNVEHIILRTLLADGSASDSQPLKYPMEQILRVYRSGDTIRNLKDERSEDYTVLQYLDNCSLILQRRRLFQARGFGVIQAGLGDWLVKSGDLVCIFYGSSVPCLLREHAPFLKSSERQYKLIGSCCLDGWMYGNYPLSNWGNDFDNNPDTFTLI